MRSEVWDHYQMMADAAPDVTVLREKSVRTAKEHLCCWCKKPIEIGQLHRYTAYVEDGDFKSARECGHCIAGGNDG